MPKKPSFDIPGEGFDPAKTSDLPGGRLNPSAFRRNALNGMDAVRVLAQKIKSGDIVALSKGITLIESNKDTDRPLSRELISLCLNEKETTVRIGISGSPGVGKSTFIESLGQALVEQNKKLAVLAIDPTSSLTGGSILGDKTRMINLSTHPNAYIRPTPAGKMLGGVARYTREAIILCEAAGYDVILIETVGVGQSETIVESMVDLFVLLILPGAGDDLQGIKRGVVEMADLLVVNKADGERINLANQAKASYTHALHLFPPKESGSLVEVCTCSSVESTGIIEIWQRVLKLLETHHSNGYFTKRRNAQLLHWFEETIRNNLFDLFNNNQVIKEEISMQENAILSHKLSPFDAAESLLKRFIEELRKN